MFEQLANASGYFFLFSFIRAFAALLVISFTLDRILPISLVAGLSAILALFLSLSPGLGFDSSVGSEIILLQMPGEVVVGVLMGIAAAAGLSIFFVAGSFLDEVLNADKAGRVFSSMMGLLSVCLFAASGGTRILFTLFIEAARSVKPGGLLTGQGLPPDLVAGLVSLVTFSFLMGIVLIAPVLVASIFTGLAASFIDKAYARGASSQVTDMVKFAGQFVFFATLWKVVDYGVEAMIGKLLELKDLTM